MLKSKHFKYVLSSGLLIASPWILLLITIFISGGSISTTHPYWTDELFYWHEALSLAQKGLEFGYYTIDESTPQYLSFGMHGFGTVSIYALYAKLFGWELNSIVIANCSLVSLSFLFLIVLTKPNIKYILLLAAFYGTFLPIILYNASSMSELLNYSGLIVYMSALYLYLKSTNKSNWIFVLLLLICTYLSFIRIIYIVLFIPVLFEKNKVQKIDANFWRTSAIWIAISGFLYVFVSKLTTPYPFSFLAELSSTPSITKFISVFASHAWKNTIKMISPVHETAIQISLRYCFIALMVFLVWKSEIIKNKYKKWNSPYLYLFIIMFSIVVVTILGYYVSHWRDYRVIAPILFSVLAITSLYNSKILKIGIACNILSIALMFTANYDQFFSTERYRTIKNFPDLKTIEYLENVKSPFENTITFDYSPFDEVFSIPAGIGMNLTFGAITDSLQSHYIYSSKEYKLDTYQVVSSSPQGILYRKQQSN